MQNTPKTLRPDFTAQHVPVLWAAGLALVLSACAGPRAMTKADWLPDPAGWEVRDLDEADPPRWVVYERDALTADVKELRIVGLVDAEPKVVARALRERLLDDANIPDGTQRQTLRATEHEVVTYGLSSMPFPFDDREATERLRFSHDPGTGAYVVDVRSIDPGDPAKPGVLRIPLVHNTFVVAPAKEGQSAVTMDTVHDLGGHFPNWAIYGPIHDFLVAELAALNEAVASTNRAHDGVSVNAGG